MKKIIGIVQNVEVAGKHGPFAVATVDGLEGSVTFALSPPVWSAKDHPSPGSKVVLSDLTQKRAGWRAGGVKPYSFQDKEWAKKRELIATAKSKALVIERSEPELVRATLYPLSEYLSQGICHANKSISIGSFWSSHPEMIVAHDYFVEREVLPALKEATKSFGLYQVAKELVEVALPGYGVMGEDDMACFWGSTVCDKPDVDRDGMSPQTYKKLWGGRTNSELAATLGVKRYFGPIMDLAIAHVQANLFCPSKFFNCHATRIGQVAGRFSYVDYLAYVEMCKRLLKNGLYDWTIEQTPERWDMLEPAIKLYGFEEVIEPMMQAYLSIADIPGTKDCKYHYSLFAKSVADLYPYLIPLAVRRGVSVIYEALLPIANGIRDLYHQGVFLEPNDGSQIHREEKFFAGIGQDYLDLLPEMPVNEAVKIVSTSWTPKLHGFA